MMIKKLNVDDDDEREGQKKTIFHSSIDGLSKEKISGFQVCLTIFMFMFCFFLIQQCNTIFYINNNSQKKQQQQQVDSICDIFNDDL